MNKNNVASARIRAKDVRQAFADLTNGETIENSNEEIRGIIETLLAQDPDLTALDIARVIHVAPDADAEAADPDDDDEDEDDNEESDSDDTDSDDDAEDDDAEDDDDDSGVIDFDEEDEEDDADLDNDEDDDSVDDSETPDMSDVDVDDSEYGADLDSVLLEEEEEPKKYGSAALDEEAAKTWVTEDDLEPVTVLRTRAYCLIEDQCKYEAATRSAVSEAQQAVDRRKGILAYLPAYLNDTAVGAMAFRMGVITQSKETRELKGEARAKAIRRNKPTTKEYTVTTRKLVTFVAFNSAITALIGTPLAIQVDGAKFNGVDPETEVGFARLEAVIEWLNTPAHIDEVDEVRPEWDDSAAEDYDPEDAVPFLYADEGWFYMENLEDVAVRSKGKTHKLGKYLQPIVTEAVPMSVSVEPPNDQGNWRDQPATVLDFGLHDMLLDANGYDWAALLMPEHDAASYHLRGPNIAVMRHLLNGRDLQMFVHWMDGQRQRRLERDFELAPAQKG